MKKIGVFLLFICCFFALFLELSGVDKEKRFSIRGYVDYITTNIEPLPRVSFSFSNVENIKDLVDVLGDGFGGVGEFIRVLFDNIGVILYGLFPVDVVGGSGFGGGVGGAR